MRSIEIKFLFEGIIFTTPVHIIKLDGNNRIELLIMFSTKYLINQFGRCYKFILENNRFIATFTTRQKEAELIKSIQEAILEQADALT